MRFIDKNMKKNEILHMHDIKRISSLLLKMKQKERNVGEGNKWN